MGNCKEGSDAGAHLSQTLMKIQSTSNTTGNNIQTFSADELRDRLSDKTGGACGPRKTAWLRRFQKIWRVLRGAEFGAEPYGAFSQNAFPARDGRPLQKALIGLIS